MNSQSCIEILDYNKSVFETLLKNISEEEYLWKPTPEKWCLLEVVCHLYDEEREDFRARIESTLENPDKEWIKIDPPAWVTDRNYMKQNYTSILAKFLEERDKSILWLEGLQNPKWDNAYIHPKVGAVPAIRLLANWVAHDYLHLRQIIRLKYEFLEAHTDEPLDYAGAW
ncbi:DinB family protein [Ulvibacter sp. MAR_2010_11]|uniref:DinB family protein n=1 Tax=Ulvibacter sp. MAR_2010_11 TaxID=1250229 RepID=UPI000C2B5F3C|nr:DinB family protein [Ulvibacter sp. MAR_2010_11]PKA84610.1 DinB family protein [Ulvibacter sp. MAR_2010_11]